MSPSPEGRDRSGWSRADPQLGQTLRMATEGDSTPPSGRIGRYPRTRIVMVISSCSVQTILYLPACLNVRL